MKNIIVLQYSTIEININKTLCFYSIVLLTKYFYIISVDSENNLMRWSGHYPPYQTQKLKLNCIKGLSKVIKLLLSGIGRTELQIFGAY